MGIFDFFKKKKEEVQQETPNQEVQEEQPEDDKHFLDFDLMHQQALVHLESVYRNQEIVFRRATEANRTTLGEILTGLFKMERSSIKSMAYIYRLDYGNEKTLDVKIISDLDEIWNFDLIACCLKNKTEDGFFTQGLFHENTIVIESKERTVILAITSLGGIDTLKYLRVTLLSPDNSEKDDCRSLQTNNTPNLISFILSFNEVEDNPELDYFEKVERSTHEKLKSAERYHEIDEVEAEYIHGMHEYRPEFYVGYGRYLLKGSRYYDAYVTLERAYYYLKPELNDCSENWLSAYYDVCNMMGTCLSKLDREEEAAYFYKQGLSKIPLDKPNNLALSKARLGDPSGNWLMNNWLNMVAQKYGSHDNWTEEIKQFSVDVPVALVKWKKEMDAYIASSPKYDDAITIGFILDRLFGIKQKNLAACMFIYDQANNQFLTRLEDVDSISNFPLNVEQAKDKVFVLSCTYTYYLINEKEDKSILCYNAPIIISTHAINTEDSSAVMRVDMMRCNFQYDDDKRRREKFNTPLNATFSLGVSTEQIYTPTKESLLEAIKEEILLEKDWRVIEAYKLAKWVYDCSLYLLKEETGLSFSDEDDPLLWNIYMESCYRVGYCLMELGKPEVAAYYLEIASKSMKYDKIQEYINCLSNMMDPQALEVVDDVIKKSPMPDTEEKKEQWNYHMAFLKRRKAYILIDKKRYSEARQLLEEMLYDPLSKDFAEGELKYIKQMMQAK